MIVLRVLGRILIFLAIPVTAIGIWVWLSGNATVPLGRVWFTTDHTSLNNVEVFVGRYLNAPDVWRDYAVPYLKLAAWEAVLWPIIVLLASGGILLALGRRRRRRSLST